MRAGASRGRQAALGQGPFLSHRTAAALPLPQDMPELFLLPLVTHEIWGRVCSPALSMSGCLHREAIKMPCQSCTVPQSPLTVSSDTQRDADLLPSPGTQEMPPSSK